MESRKGGWVEEGEKSLGQEKSEEKEHNDDKEEGRGRGGGRGSLKLSD